MAVALSLLSLDLFIGGEPDGDGAGAPSIRVLSFAVTLDRPLKPIPTI